MTLAAWTHGLAAFAYLVTAVVALLRGLPRTGSLLFAVAALATSLWAGSVALAEWGVSVGIWPRVVEVSRSTLWIALVVMLAWPIATESRRLWQTFIVVAVALAIASAGALLLAGYERPAGMDRLFAIGLGVLGLVVVENLFRNLSEAEVWALKYLLIALSTMFFLDIMVHSVTYLFGLGSPSVIAARALVSVALIPLLLVTAVRDAAIAINLYASRRVVFYSATLVAAGLYLIVTALVGAYARAFGGEAGTTLAAVLVVLAILALAVAFLSGTVRSAVKLFISQNFFSYKYDYRVEWNRLINTISTDNDLLGLQARCIKAVADLVDSHSGILWFRDGSRPEFACTAGWSVPAPVATLPADDPIVSHLQANSRIVDLANPATVPADVALEGASVLAGLGDPWLIIPLAHRDRMVGIIVLMQPRVSRHLDDEDYGLLRLIGSQIASYLVEELSYRALTDARQLEEFNKRFAFVAHDLKNLVGQQSLMVRNAEKFGDNPEFRADLVATLRSSVEKMRTLLGQLSQGRAAVDRERAAQQQPGHGDLVGVARGLATRWLAGDRRIEVRCDQESVLVRLNDIDKLTNVLEHLVQNALEATSNGAPVVLRVGVRAGHGMIEVVDKGPGMDADFVRDELFRPFRSTKGGGYGIGAYQARESMRELGGNLEVETRRGQGTTMRIVLPLISRPLDAPAADRQLS